MSNIAITNDNNSFAPSFFFFFFFFFGHCVNLSVIVLDLPIFLWELRSLRKIPRSKTRSKTITSDFTQ